MKVRKVEDRIIERIFPSLEEKLEKRLAKKLGIAIKEEYPSEIQFKPKFIREVKAAQKRVKQGKGKVYTYEKFKNKFLTKVKR